MILRFIYVVDMKAIKITFTLLKINMITIFTLINSFICCFFFRKLNNFVCFISPVVEKWSIHMKRLVATPALLAFSRALLLTMRLLRSRWWGNHYSSGKLQRFNCIYTTVYMYLGLQKQPMTLKVQSSSIDQRCKPRSCNVYLKK